MNSLARRRGLCYKPLRTSLASSSHSRHLLARYYADKHSRTPTDEASTAHGAPLTVPVSPIMQDPVSLVDEVEEDVLDASQPRRKYSRFDRDLPFPDLTVPEPVYDLKNTAEFPPRKNSGFHPTKVTVWNDPSMFIVQREIAGEEREARATQEGEEEEMEEEEEEEEEDTRRLLRLSQAEIAALHKYTLISRIVVQQTPKGKVQRFANLVVVGNGNGLVGYGEGKAEDMPRANQKAWIEAVRNMDYVDRFEHRTVWTEMESKMGSTRIILRPRPVGFGLHCNPNIHQVLKAAGIKDISAKVWGSRNPMAVIKLLFRMLYAGNAPLAMGNGIGGRGRKLDKGSGMRGKQEIERDRGRKLLDLRVR